MTGYLSVAELATNTLELNPLKIALEGDGDGDGDSVYHTRTNFAADMNRQRFIRIRSSQFIRAE